VNTLFRLRDTAQVASQREQLLRRAFEAFNNRDADALVAIVDPEFEMITRVVRLEGRSFRGYGGVRDYWRFLDEGWREIVFELVDAKDAGPHVLAAYRMRGVSRDHGVAVDQPVSMLITFRDDKLLRLQTFFDPAEAVAAAGLSDVAPGLEEPS
jgi:ketosteroid isomerase-like protein